MRKLIVMRGLPGSGKSIVARDLFRQHQLQDDKFMGAICSADDFFIDPSNGSYKFNSQLLGKAHGFCKFKVTQAMRRNFDLVIIDNTNIMKWEYEPYVSLVRRYNYETEIKTVGNLTDLATYAERNTHMVPLEAIQKMATRWEA